DRDAFADVERRTGPTLSHQAVRARELEAPLDALFAFDRSASPLFVAARVAQVGAAAPLAYLVSAHVDPCVRIGPLDLEDFTRDLDLPSGVELRGERMMGR